MPALILILVVAACGCASWRAGDDAEQRERAQALRSAVETRGKPAAPGLEAAGAAAEAIAEKIQDKAPELSEKAERAGDAAADALDAAFVAAEPAAEAAGSVVKTAMIPVAAVVLTPVVAAGAAADALKPRVKSETMARFERSASVKLTRNEIARLLALVEDSRAEREEAPKKAAEVLSELDPAAKGAEDYVKSMLDSPYQPVREAAASKLRQVALAKGPPR